MEVIKCISIYIKGISEYICIANEMIKLIVINGNEQYTYGHQEWGEAPCGHLSGGEASYGHPNFGRSPIWTSELGRSPVRVSELGRSPMLASKFWKIAK